MDDTLHCTQCGEYKPVSEFYVDKRKKAGGFISKCKECKIAENSAWQQRNTDLAHVRSREHKRRRTLWVHAIKLERGCADCGYAEHPEALHFDHLPGYKKLFQVSGVNLSRETIIAEIEKCEVVCANCHAVRTARRRLAVASEA